MKKCILFVFLSLFVISSVFAQEGLQRIRLEDFSGGMNSFDVPHALQPNQGASMVNVVVNRAGRISKRKGQSIFNIDVGDTAFLGLGRFDPDKTTSYMAVASGTDIIASLSNDTAWRVANQASPLTSGQNTEFVQANDLLFALNGYDNTSWWNGATYTLGWNWPSSPPTATTGAWVRNYLFLAGGTTHPDWIYFSNVLKPTVFDASDIRKVSTGDGQAIQRLMKYRLNEVIVYKERSIYVLDITSTTDNWTIQPISSVIGTDAPRSVVSLGNDQWFLSSEPIAIRSLVRSEFDKILVNYVSKPIQDIFEGTNTSGFNLNVTHVSKSCAVLYDNKYILAIPTGTSTVNNTVVVYDFLVNAWYIIKGWYPSAWVEFGNNLYYIDANDGRVLRCFTGTIGDFTKGPTYTAYASDPTEGIEFVYVTPDIEFDAPETFKKMDAVELQLEPTGNYEAIAWANLDNNGWASLGSINLAGNSLTLPVDLPTQLKNSGTARKTFQTQSLGEFRDVAFMVTNSTSQQTIELQRVSIFSDPKQWRRQ